MTPRAWVPLSDASLASEAWSAIEAVIADLAEGPEPSFGLAGGAAGMALLHDALARNDPDGHHARRARELLDRSTESVVAEVPSAGLFDGLAGVAFAIHQLSDEAEAAEQTEDVDALLLQRLRNPVVREGDFDLIGGIAGIGVYGLRASGTETGRQLVQAAVDALAATAERTEGGSAWRTPARMILRDAERFPTGRYDFGVAHGAAGVVGFLAAACTASLGGDTARDLLGRSVRWLLDEQLESRAPTSFSEIRPAQVKRAVNPSRSAWCYGDPATAVILLAAARALASSELADDALRIARRAAARPSADTGVVDAGLCHGSAGLAHIYNRLFQATGEPLFADASRDWFARTLAYRQPRSAGLGTFPSWSVTRQDSGGWSGAFAKNLGFLEGGAGVALALLASLENVPPTWDQLLLTTLPARPR